MEDGLLAKAADAAGVEIGGVHLADQADPVATMHAKIAGIEFLVEINARSKCEIVEVRSQ